MNPRSSIVRFSRSAIVALTLLLAPAALAQNADDDSTPQAKAAPAVTGVLNINTAVEEELIRLPGVGPSRAQAIIELRTKLSGFKKVEDLMRVKGIGRKTFQKLAPMLRLDGKTTLVSR